MRLKDKLEKRKLDKQKREQEQKDPTLMDHSPLRPLVPTKGLEFNSDYTKIKDGIGSQGNAYRMVLRLFVNHAAARDLDGMWGTGLFTTKLPSNVSAKLIQSISRVDDRDVQSQLERAEKEVDDRTMMAGHGQEAQRSFMISRDISRISEDLLQGSKYHEVAYKLVLTAPTLDQLDRAYDIVKIQFQKAYRGAFSWYPFEGEQRQENSNLFNEVWRISGKPLKFTSAELAGTYNLVTHGVSDPYGEYVGELCGEVAANAMVLDVDNFRSHVIIGSDEPAIMTRNQAERIPLNTRQSAVWGKKIVQSALMDGHKVVSIVLDNTDLRKLGDDDIAYTTYIHVNQGAINPFEIFGNDDQQIAAFAAHSEMLSQMAYQLNDQLTQYDRGELLRDTLKEFYIHQGRWLPNASSRLDELRCVGLPHDKYPTLRLFIAYLRERRKQAKIDRDDQNVEGYSRLLGAFDQMMESNDLFDLYTDSKLDESADAPNIVYDFRSLTDRSPQIAMAQLINTFDYAVRTLGTTETDSSGAGDVLVIYGADELDLSNDLFRRFITDKMRSLARRDVRIVWLYNNTTEMLKQSDLNQFGLADYVLCGKVSPNMLEKPVEGGIYGRSQFEKSLGVELNMNFLESLKSLNPQTMLLHRQDVNVFFKQDLVLFHDSGIGTELIDKEVD